MIDLSKVPDHALEEQCRILDRSIREFFSNMTPAQEADFKRFCEEYDRKHGLASEPDTEGGGEIQCPKMQSWSASIPT